MAKINALVSISFPEVFTFTAIFMLVMKLKVTPETSQEQPLCRGSLELSSFAREFESHFLTGAETGAYDIFLFFEK